MIAPTPPPGRLRALWRAAHAEAAGVPPWARNLAYVIPFLVLPSSLWRIAVCTFHAPIALGDTTSGTLPRWLPLEVYVVLLSLLTELLAFTAVGLVARWGEVFPRWIPVLRGRRVPVPAAVIPATAGAAALTAIWTACAATIPFQRTLAGQPLHDGPMDFHHWQGILAVAAYTPLLLWGPLLGALTLTYWRRRTRRT